MLAEPDHRSQVLHRWKGHPGICRRTRFSAGGDDTESPVHTDAHNNTPSGRLVFPTIVFGPAHLILSFA